MKNGNGTASPQSDEERIQGVLRKAHSRFYRNAGGEWVTPHGTSKSPDEELMELEERAEREIEEAARELSDKARQLAWAAFRDFEDSFIEWVFAKGPDPLEAMRRLFLYVRKKRASLLWNMGVRDVGKLFGQSHGTPQHLAKILFGDLPGGAQKMPSARAKMALAQQGNNNRLGGRRAHPKARQLSFTRKLNASTNGKHP